MSTRTVPDAQVLTAQPNGQCSRCTMRASSVLVKGLNGDRFWILADFDRDSGLWVEHECRDPERATARKAAA